MGNIAAFSANVEIFAGSWRNESWRAQGRRGQNGRVTPGQSTVSEMLPLRDTDPREVGGYRLLGR
jgi:hypothetical protein